MEFCLNPTWKTKYPSASFTIASAAKSVVTLANSNGANIGIDPKSDSVEGRNGKCNATAADSHMYNAVLKYTYGVHCRFNSRLSLNGAEKI
jgi:hypothetical protein